MLSETRNELEPRQWELLDSKLTEAERAWERFDTLARSSGKAAEVEKGVEGAAKAGRTTETIRGIEVELNDIFGSSTKDCEKSAHLERAKREADNWAQAQDKGRPK